MVGAVEAISDIPEESGVRRLDLQDPYDFAPEAYLSNEPDTRPSPLDGMVSALNKKCFEAAKWIHAGP